MGESGMPTTEINGPRVERETVAFEVNVHLVVGVIWAIYPPAFAADMALLEASHASSSSCAP
jgi:hypothetical protein